MIKVSLLSCICCKKNEKEVRFCHLSTVFCTICINHQDSGCKVMERYEIINKMNVISRNGYSDKMGIEQQISFLQHTIASLLTLLMKKGFTEEEIKDILDGY